MADASEIINDVIAEFTDEKKVDLLGIANKLGIRIYQTDFEHASDLGRAEFPATAERPRILLNKKNEKAQSFTVVALLLASCVISPEAVQQIGVTYDIFTLSDTIKKRYSSTMFMATRLAIPAKVIEQLDEPGFSIEQYAKSTPYIPEFITAVVKDSSANFLMES